MTDRDRFDEKTNGNNFFPLDQLHHSFFSNVILFCNAIHYKCNISLHKKSLVRSPGPVKIDLDY